MILFLIDYCIGAAVFDNKIVDGWFDVCRQCNEAVHMMMAWWLQYATGDGEALPDANKPITIIIQKVIFSQFIRSIWVDGSSAEISRWRKEALWENRTMAARTRLVPVGLAWIATRNEALDHIVCYLTTCSTLSGSSLPKKTASQSASDRHFIRQQSKNLPPDLTTWIQRHRCYACLLPIRHRLLGVASLRRWRYVIRSRGMQALHREATHYSLRQLWSRIGFTSGLKCWALSCVDVSKSSLHFEASVWKSFIDAGQTWLQFSM